MFLNLKYLIFTFFSVALHVRITESQLFNLHIPVDDGLCKDWTSIENYTPGNCTWNELSFQCFGSMDNFHNLLKSSPEQIKVTDELIFCGWPNKTFDAPVILRHFRHLRTLRIEHSNLTHIVNDFPDLPYLENINISWTKLAYTRPTLFQNVKRLKMLDLRWNQLDHMEGPLLMAPRFGKLYLGGNPWNCTKNFKWILNDTKSQHVLDRDQLMCSDSQYNGRFVLTVMHFKKKLKEACFKNSELHNCTCTLSYIRLSDDGQYFQPLYSINCSNLNLYNLPSTVPENTTIFYANDNKIDNVEPLRTTYRMVQDIYLDFNLIHSIDSLDTEYWLKNFRTFSLKGNKLTKIPVYALDNALEKNHNVVQLFLSHNPWRCDCLFTMRFQELLRKYNTVIKDSTDVTCKYIEGDDNFGAQVLSLTRGDVCKLSTEYKVQPLDLLNGVLGSLIILILGKLGYDYYHYRKSGRLPWIVTKMP